MTPRSAASTALCGTGSAALSTSRSNSALVAVSGSPVTSWSWRTAASESTCLPTRHCSPDASTLSCPSVRDASNADPIAFGALHSAGDRAQSHAHRAYGLSGSCSAAFHSPQPHDQTEAMPVSEATCCRASSCHFATWYHAVAGSSPLRPPKPFVVAKLVTSPSRFGAIPIAVKSPIACRYDSRRLRLPRIAPCFHVTFAGT